MVKNCTTTNLQRKTFLMAHNWTEQQKDFVHYLVHDPECQADAKKAAVKAGYSPATSTTNITNSCQDLILEETLTYFKTKGPLAAKYYMEILSDPARPGTANKIKVLQDILDRMGLVRNENRIDVQVSTPSALVFLPPKEQTEAEEVESTN